MIFFIKKRLTGIFNINKIKRHIINTMQIIKIYLPVIFIMQIIIFSTSHAKEHPTGNWQKVNIIYFHDFPPPKKETQRNILGCFVSFNYSSASGFTVLPILRCIEQVHLLRPEKIIQHWKRMQTRNGFIKFSLPEFGINHVKAIITEAISPPVNKIPSGRFRGSHTDIITGTFIRHATSVGTYHFKEEKTGRTVSINVTDNHRFYVKNKHAFIPIKMISPGDQMITATGNIIRLLCTGDKLHDCGQPYTTAQTTMVYNVETDHRHMYFAGDTAILVHNDCVRIKVKIYDDNGNKIYEGEIDKKTEKRDGEGISYYPNGRKKYDGTWKQGELHGFGTFHMDNERNTVAYKGMHLNNQRDGLGYVYNPDGDLVYAGMHSGGQYNGQGTLHHKGGYPRFEGSFENHRPHGLGTSFHLKGGKDYQGLWAEGKPEDIAGIEFCQNEDGDDVMRYRGGWKGGLKHGRGILFTIKGFPEIDGEWYQDRLIKSRSLK